jgi:hypothetical protein
VRDEARGAWVKNGHAKDVEAVLAYCRRERAQRTQSTTRLHGVEITVGANAESVAGE